ncbi:MAG: SWIM zinc finger family protein [Acidobacteriota bacterium]|nr:SWIM zinc finger family protein [Acidobacteriota bacterium]
MAFDKWNRYGGFPPPSVPRSAKGGIKATAQRGKFGASWWARRWIQVLESFELGSRLQRGRSYARKGQVLSIEVGRGVVEGLVQGSRPTPYQVKIKVRPLLEPEWKRIAEKLSTQVLFAAKLLAGEMPAEIESVFSEAGLSLFPQKLSEITTSCSCPDWSNPCKHVAAVYYLLGEAFDRDPFLIFRMRGMDREEFAAILGESRVEEEVAHALAPVAPPEPLPVNADEFWGAKKPVPDLFEDVTAPKAVAALPRRLGNLQFWRGELPLIRALEPSYENASRRGEEILIGEKG